MRVLIVTSRSIVTGGADRHCFDLATILETEGHEVEFLSTDSPGRRIGGAFVPLLVSNETRDGLAGRDRTRVAQRALWNRQAAGAMEELIRRFSPDVVHAHKIHPHLSVAPLVVASRHGIPIVQTVHDYEFVSANPYSTEGGRYDREEARASYRLLNSLLFQIRRRSHVPRVDRWIAVSRAVAETCRRAGIEATVLPNFTLFPVGGKPRDERRGVLYAGRLNAVKGIRQVIRLAEELPEIEVRVAGTGPMRDEVDRAAATLPNLKPLGYLEEQALREELESSLVTLIPSLWAEPGSLTCLESMAAGTPVLAYEMGGLGQFVKDSGAGIALPKDTPLAGTVRSLIDDREEWARMSDRAETAATTVHSPRRYAGELEGIYRSVTTGASWSS